MTARTDGSVHDDQLAPPCFACHDDIPQSPRSLIDGENWMCDDRPGCLERQDRINAAKQREADKFLTAEWFAEHDDAFDPNTRPLIIPPGDDVAQPDGLPEVTP